MNIKTLKNLKKNLKDEKSVLRVVLLVIALVTILNYTSIESIKVNERVVVVPLNQSSQFWVSANDASNKYITNLGLYVLQLWQNYTPANVEHNFARILELTASGDYQQIKEQLKNKANIIKRYNRNSYSFAKSKVQINKKTREIIITGLQTRWTKSGKKQPEKMQLKISYKITNAKFEISKLSENKL